jgi:hypothetical protein
MPHRNLESPYADREAETAPDALAREKHERRYGRGVKETHRGAKDGHRDGLALRWGQCHMLLNRAKGERVSFAELGALLARRMPWRKTPLDQAITFRLESGERSARVEEIAAMVTVLRDHGIMVDPGWLAFGDESRAPAPDPEALLSARLFV